MTLSFRGTVFLFYKASSGHRASRVISWRFMPITEPPVQSPLSADLQAIARFVDAQHYAASFGFQWHRYQKTQLDHDELRESEHHFLAKTALRPEDLKGKFVLDVGCGMGCFAEVATRWG